MATTSTYRLRFRSSLHVGERGVGLEETHCHLPADTLFSAICTVWRWLYGADSLQSELLQPFLPGENPPFILTSAFPFAGEVLFFPKPLGRWGNVTLRGEDKGEKQLKRVRWVSSEVLRSWVQGEELAYDSANCIGNGVIWCTPEEKAQLQDFTDDETADIVLWRTAVAPRVTLDRVTSASQIWFFGYVAFVSGAGLWCAVRYFREELKSRVEACLRLLGDSGLGGERGAGYGLFTVDEAPTTDLPEFANASYCLTLSPCCPTREQLQNLIDPNAAYNILPRRGWVGSPEGGNLRRKLVHMFAEGSVLKYPPGTMPGSLVNVKPDPCPHDVWRYGYAFPLGVNR